MTQLQVEPRTRRFGAHPNARYLCPTNPPTTCLVDRWNVWTGGRRAGKRPRPWLPLHPEGLDVVSADRRSEVEAVTSSIHPPQRLFAGTAMRRQTGEAFRVQGETIFRGSGGSPFPQMDERFLPLKGKKPDRLTIWPSVQWPHPAACRCGDHPLVDEKRYLR